MHLLGACFVIVGALAVLMAFFMSGSTAQLNSRPTFVTGFALMAIGILVGLIARFIGPQGHR